tara:strand:- start:523 stop:678 length:156 start_codon:yes stop_codon:yes gene_type:complete
MKNLSLLIFISFSFSQLIDESDIALEELKSALEIASRSEQKVFVDDFTGLN